MMLPFDQYVAFDQCVVPALLLVVMVGGMRLFYGAWPWEASKTWYRTRPAVDYVEALRGQDHDLVPRMVRNVSDNSGDTFDRSLVVNDNLPPEVASPPKASPPAQQLREPKLTEKPSRVRRRWLKPTRRKQPTHTAETATLTTDAETAPLTTDARTPTVATVEASFVPMLSANVRIGP
jgi:hypothetical protein